MWAAGASHRLHPHTRLSPPSSPAPQESQSPVQGRICSPGVMDRDTDRGPAAREQGCVPGAEGQHAQSSPSAALPRKRCFLPKARGGFRLPVETHQENGEETRPKFTSVLKQLSQKSGNRSRKVQ